MLLQATPVRASAGKTLAGWTHMRSSSSSSSITGQPTQASLPTMRLQCLCGQVLKKETQPCALLAWQLLRVWARCLCGQFLRKDRQPCALRSWHLLRCGRGAGWQQHEPAAHSALDPQQQQQYGLLHVLNSGCKRRVAAARAGCARRARPPAAAAVRLAAPGCISQSAPAGARAQAGRCWLHLLGVGAGQGMSAGCVSTL